MPLPNLRRAYGAERENAREFAKRTLLTCDPERAAAEVGAPLEVVQSLPEASRLARAVEPEEQSLLQATAEADLAAARRALDSREGRQAWLTGVMTGALKVEGAFGAKKDFPPNVKLQAARLLLLMHGDLIQKHEIKVTEETVVVFHVPDNGRLPDSAHIVDALPEGDV